jgi:ribosomal protein S18 acetylase RimI-like enzyme
MRIEAAAAEDVDALVDQWVELAREQRAYDTHILAEPNRGRIRETFLRRVVTGELLVAREDDAADGSDIAGFVSFALEPGNFEDDCERGVVSNLYVRPERRDEGLGSELLSAAEDNLAEAGADAVALEAMAKNEAARRFYRRHGYEPFRVELEKELDR